MQKDTHGPKIVRVLPWIGFVEVPSVGGRPRIADVKADAAVKLYLARETPVPDICAATGISKSTLHRVLRERGLVVVGKETND